MFRLFEGATADTAWRSIALAFSGSELPHNQQSRAGATKEVLHAAISIEDPRQRWVTSRQPALNVAFALAEVIWMLRGRNDSAFLNYFNRQLPKYAGDGECYHGAYGHRLRKAFRIDQLERAYQVLQNNPDSRQVVLQIWSPFEDLPESTGEAVSPDIPCNLSSIVKVRNGRLEWLQILRSNDVYRGLPYNFVQFTTMQEVLAGWLGLDVGAYHHLSDSLHLYEVDSAGLMTAGTNTEGVEVINQDSLAEDKDASDAAFRQLELLVEKLIREDFATEELANMRFEPPLPTGFQNIARVLAAEAARRRKRPSIAENIIQTCTNPVFAHLYRRWLARVECRMGMHELS